MKENKGAFDENGDAITRGYVEPKYKIIDISKIEVRIAELEKEIENMPKSQSPFHLMTALEELKEILQQAQDIPKQEESSNWDEINLKWNEYLNSIPKEDWKDKWKNGIPVWNWLKEHYNPPVKR